MRAALLSIGNELLRGDILDTNAQFLERELKHLGVDVVRVTQIGDELAPLRDSVTAALIEADILLCTGGLGPTADDLTRDAIAAALDEQMYEDERLVRDLHDRFSLMRRQMVPSNYRQALLIPSAEAIPNPNGTAPGWYVQREGKIIAAMPGPPSEMQPMWHAEVRTRLASQLHGSLAPRGVMTFGLGESLLEKRIQSLIDWRPDVTVATYAKATGVQVHITARAERQQEADTLLAEAEARLDSLIGEFIFGHDNQTLSEVVGQLTLEQGHTIGVMESATGGTLASAITDVPGSSEYFLGGVIAYARSIKEQYGVSAETIEEYGVYSAETALAMADAARSSTGASIGLGVTGIAGATEQEGKPSGTCFVAVVADDSREVREIHRPGNRQTLKAYFAQCTLDLLRRTLDAGGGEK